MCRESDTRQEVLRLGLHMQTGPIHRLRSPELAPQYLLPLHNYILLPTTSPNGHNSDQNEGKHDAAPLSGPSVL